jgi:hypothetical protein
MQNRRRYKRITKCFMSWIKFIWSKLKSKDASYPSGWDMVTTCDLGAGGIMFNYDRPVEAGTKIKLRVIFPFKEEPIDCVGTVLRSEKVESRKYYDYFNIYRIAAEFEKIRKADKGLIDRVANDMCA